MNSAMPDTLIVQDPDGSIHIATEIKKKEYSKLICWSCRTEIIYEKGGNTVKCMVCNQINGVLKPIFVQCTRCTALLQAPANSHLIRCSCCRVILRVGAR
mmetsp:Transcript_56502/g.64525  ORF Transcript_56502/g.64525 Transcript_56502/m.64525 type:complete len:100 (+) Transcript_56502:30-329(+)